MTQRDTTQPAGGSPVERGVRPRAWIDASGQPHHLRYLQGARERRLYGPLQPLYDQAALDAAYESGWRAAANWADRDDLHADVDSPAYEADRRKSLGA